MRIQLQGEHLRTYMEIKRQKRLLGMPDKRTPTEKIRIRKCHLCPRQRMKLAEMTLEDFP